MTDQHPQGGYLPGSNPRAAPKGGGVAPASEPDDDLIEVKLSQGFVTFICAKCGEPVSITYDNVGDALDDMGRITRGDCNH